MLRNLCTVQILGPGTARSPRAIKKRRRYKRKNKKKTFPTRALPCKLHGSASGAGAAATGGSPRASSGLFWGAGQGTRVRQGRKRGQAGGGCGVAWRGEEGMRSPWRTAVWVALYLSEESRVPSARLVWLDAHAYSQACTSLQAASTASSASTAVCCLLSAALRARLLSLRLTGTCTSCIALRCKLGASSRAQRTSASRTRGNSHMATSPYNPFFFRSSFSSCLHVVSPCLARPHVHAPPSASVSLGCRGAAGEDPASLAPPSALSTSAERVCLSVGRQRIWNY